MTLKACKLINAGDTYQGKQGLSYFAGVWAESAAPKVLHLHLLTIPASVQHLSANCSQTELCVGIIARTDPNEQECMVLLPELDALVQN